MSRCTVWTWVVLHAVGVFACVLAIAFSVGPSGLETFFLRTAFAVLGVSLPIHMMTPTQIGAKGDDE